MHRVCVCVCVYIGPPHHHLPRYFQVHPLHTHLIKHTHLTCSVCVFDAVSRCQDNLTHIGDIIFHRLQRPNTENSLSSV